MKLTTRIVDLRLKHTFTVAHSEHAVQRSLIVDFRDGEHTGYGEGASLDYFGVTADDMRGHVEAVRDRVEAAAWTEPAELYDALEPHLAHDRFALCAVDEAAHDLWGKRRGQPVWQLWGLELVDLPLSDYTIGIAPIDEMVDKLAEVPGWPSYKIKLGTAHDLDIVRTLRQHTDAPFRIDANCAWNADETLRNADVLAGLGVEFLEQPLPAGDIDGMRRVFAGSALPVVADESCLVEADVARCAGLFHGVNIKLTKCGGLTPARRMIDRARALDLKVMVGCMTESTVGISAIGQLLPLLDWVDMDGAALLAEDIADGVRVERGRAVYPEVAGTGVTMR